MTCFFNNTFVYVLVLRSCFTDSSRLSQDSGDYADYAIPPDAMPDALPDAIPFLIIPGLC